ncbi:MAG: polysaccharide deacetylase family protein [Clostridia bacterium]
MKITHRLLSLTVILFLLTAVSGNIAAKDIGRPFNDVTKNAWYYNDVYGAYENGLFAGTAENTFAPETTMSRAMMVTVLYRLAQEPALENESSYPDIEKGSWYEKAVQWAKQTKITEGFPDGCFHPYQAVSREETAKILHKYYEYFNGPADADPINSEAFTDSASVSDWAEKHVAWCVANGIIMGSRNEAENTLSICPKKGSTRGEMAAMLMRYGKKYYGITAGNYNHPIDFSGISAISNTRKDYWFGKDYDSMNRPAEPLRFQNAYGDRWNTLSIDSSGEKIIYLTFDLGYENGYTTKILDILKEKNVKAVFFVTLDYVQSRPDLVQRMIDEGHVVGNHSSTHPANGMPSMSLQKQYEDIEKLQNVLRNQFHYEMTLFRNPAGIYSEQSMALMNEMEMKSVFWSFAYGDYNPVSQPPVSSSLNNLNNRLHPGAVYLLHAVSSTNSKILGSFIDQARNQGYTFKLVVNK